MSTPSTLQCLAHSGLWMSLSLKQAMSLLESISLRVCFVLQLGNLMEQLLLPFFPHIGDLAMVLSLPTGSILAVIVRFIIRLHLGRAAELTQDMLQPIRRDVQVVPSPLTKYCACMLGLLKGQSLLARALLNFRI